VKGTHLVGAALAGAATGLRSTVGVGALTETGSSGLPTPLTTPVARVAAGLAVTGELVVDKLPNTPSRLDPPGLIARVALGSVAGAVIARASARPMVPAAVIAALAAAVSARVGHDLRQLASTRVPPLAAAVAEDVVAIGLATAAARSVG
jgi:uncharacterized membrane protein